MKYQITVNFIARLPKIPYRNGVGKYEGVVAHSTATPNATDEALRNFESTHFENAFVHFGVDWDSITQNADTNYLAWGAGFIANQRYVQVELCETADPNLFLESYRRYTWLLAYILFQRKLGVSVENTFWTHDMVTKVLGDTTHTDPVSYLASHGVSIPKLIADVTTEYNALAAPPTPIPQKKPAITPHIGELTVLVNNLNVHSSADFNSSVVKVITKGQTFNVYKMENGLYCISDNMWVSAGSPYVHFTPNKK